MSKYREKIDDIFKSLYGNYADEDGCFYKNVYYYESLNMEQDYYEYLKCRNLLNLVHHRDDIVSFIIYTEYIHIGNDHFVKHNLNLGELEEIVESLLE